MKVTAIMDTLQVSGPGKQLGALIPALEERGVHVRPLLFQPRGAEANPYAGHLTDLGIEHDVVRYEGRLDRSLIEDTRAILEARGPDIVQTHSYRPTAIATALRRRRVPWRWVAFFHGATTEALRVRAYNVLDNVLMRRADRIVVVSRPQVDRYLLHRGRVRVVNNAILHTAPGEGELAAARRRLPESEDPRIAVVGRLSSEKGVDVFLRAAELIDAPYVAAVVGDGPDRHELEGLRDELGLEGKVEFTGRVSPVEAVYGWCDLVVIPSRSEGMPNVLLEAILHSRPLVATDVGNIREILTGTELGVIVPPRAPAALASAVSAALGALPTPDPAERERVMARYRVAERAAAHEALYREVLQE